MSESGGSQLRIWRERWDGSRRRVSKVHICVRGLARERKESKIYAYMRLDEMEIARDESKL